MILLGIGVSHDAAACLVVDGVLVANAAEERFTRIKHDSGFPAAAIAYCLQEAGLTSRAIDVVAVAGQYLPRAMESHFLLTPHQAAALAAARPVGNKALRLFVGAGAPSLPLYVPRFGLSPRCTFVCVDHHLCHAAAAYFTSGRDDPCLILTMDGIGDEVSGAIWLGEKNVIELLAKWGRDASLGWFYGNVTEALGWQHGDGEGTTMALAAYGDATRVGDRLEPFHPAFASGELERPHAFGHASYLNLNGTYHWHFADAEAIRRVVQDCGAANVAARAQRILEEEVLGIVKHWTEARKLRRLACAGGVFLNVKLNQRIREEAGLDEHWVFPDAGDSGLAVGAALYAWHTRGQPGEPQRLEHLYYGPAFSDAVVREILDARNLPYRETANPSHAAAQMLAEGKIVAWFQGRMESGPRALGNRSILMSPTDAANKDIINTRVKLREKFRPFCPSILFERKDDYLLGGREENFMITAFNVAPSKRESIPAVVHVDGTLRPQTVKQQTNPRYHRLIERFGELTGEYAVLNTSFNIKGEPIVCHPRDAIRCFFDTGIDALIIGSFVLEKRQVEGPAGGRVVRP
jgi:carbamoyltransferase